MKKIFLALLIFFALLPAGAVLAQEKVGITLFYSYTCPHCEKERQFLNGLKEKYPELEVKEYEIIKVPENQQLLAEFYERYNVPPQEQGYVPVTFTQLRYFVGFNEQTGQELENCIRECVSSGNGTVVEQKIKVPLFGEINISNLSLPVLTILLGTLDGFNPCAMWVLAILISMLISSKSRKQIMIVGGTFILASGFVYFLIMSAWLNMFFALSYVAAVRIGIGIFGIAFGVWRINDFIKWKPGVCKVTDEKSKGKIIDRIKNIMKPSAVPATMIGVIVLALSVNLVEFFCSAGFPAIFTRILSLQNLPAFQYYLYVFFYVVFYMLDDAIIFAIALFALRGVDFSGAYSRWSTLVAGLLILILGVILIFKPEFLMFV